MEIRNALSGEFLFYVLSGKNVMILKSLRGIFGKGKEKCFISFWLVFFFLENSLYKYIVNSLFYMLFV